MMTINGLMQLSAGHLTPETWTWLDHQTGRGRFAPPAPVGIVRGGQVCDGWFIFADENPDDRVIPADLVAVILHARTAGCGFLLFDCDQIPLDDLPVRHPDFRRLPGLPDRERPTASSRAWRLESLIMAICPNEHMHFLLHALKSQDRESTRIYLTELVLWLLVPSNPMPNLKIAEVSKAAMEAAQETLREKAQSLRAMIRLDAGLAETLEAEAVEQDEVADALQAICHLTEFCVVRV